MMTPDEFRRHYDRLPVALLLVTREGVIESATAHALELLGCTRDDLTGRSLFELANGDGDTLRSYLLACGESSEFLPGSLRVEDVDLRLNGASSGAGSRQLLLHISPSSETQRRVLALNEKIDRLAVEVEERRRAEALTAGQNEVLGMIARDAPLREVLETLVPVFEAYTGPNLIASVLLMDSDGRLRTGAAPRLPEEFLAATEGILIGPCVGSCGTAAWRREPVAVRDIATDPLWADFREIALRNGLRACWSVPIQAADGEVLGTLALYHRSPRQPTERDWHAARIATRTAALAIERHRSTERMRDVLERQAAMLDGLQASIALIDGAGLIRAVNRNWKQWLEETSVDPDALGPGAHFTSVCDVVLRCATAPVSEMVRVVASGGANDFDGECEYDAGGQSRWVRVTAAPLPGDGSGETDVILMLVDITGRKLAESSLLSHAEELMRVNSELQQFAYVASHDLREPLRTVKSFAQLFVRRYSGQLGDDADQYLGYISEGVTRMEGLIHDLLSFSQVANGETAAAEAVDLGRVLSAVRQNLNAIISETGAGIAFDNLPVVTGNFTQLTQLFQNLVANAIKYRSAAAPLIGVTARRVERGWRVSVSDNGIGIPRQYQDTIFGLFKRLHSRKVAGTGIGLALCRKIAELHGGSITVDSEPGEGSTFHVLIPAADSARVVGVAEEAG